MKKITKFLPKIKLRVQVVQMGVDERSIRKDSLLLYWWIPKPANIKLEFLPSFAEAYIGATWKNYSQWVDTNTFQAQIEDLKPYQPYNLTVYVRVKGTPTVFPPAKYVTVRTAEGGKHRLKTEENNSFLCCQF